MKRCLLVTFAAILFISTASVANAQTSFGIKAGYNYTSLKNVEVAKDLLDQKSGYHFGILLNAKLPFGLAIQPELLYSKKGGKIEMPLNIPSVDLSLGYLELPVNLQWGFDIAGILRPHVQAGLYLGYAITNDISWGSNSDEISWDDLNRVQYGVNLGLGVDLFDFIQVSLKYMWDLGAVTNFNTGDLTSINKSNFSGIQLSVGLMF